jgi:hypothetical protein
VSGRRENDVGSRFGVDRDGGARRHHGIDIFAPRGTPVIAARAGVVRRVEVTGIGGKVVWLTDDDGNRLYYAHLDTQAVTGGQRVELGDTLGTVGNTGNAITTPPHLHFGIYRRGDGPVDPWWFVHRPRVDAPRLVADTARFGGWVRTVAGGAVLRAAPDPRSPTTFTLPGYTASRVVAAVGAWYRVRLPDGATGYLPAAAAEPIHLTLGQFDGIGPADLLATPTQEGGAERIVASGQPGTALSIHGRFGGFLLVRPPEGGEAWFRGESSVVN